jgi:hypothetical protein
VAAIYTYVKAPNSTFQYEYNGTVFTSPSLAEMCRIDEARLLEELAALPSEIGYWGAVVAYSTVKSRKLEYEFDIWCAQQDSLIRSSQAAAEGKTKMTEKSIEAALQQNPMYGRWQENIALQNLERENSLAVMQGLRAKLTALTTIAGIRRSEADAYRMTAGTEQTTA